MFTENSANHIVRKKVEENGMGDEWGRPVKDELWEKGTGDTLVPEDPRLKGGREPRKEIWTKSPLLGELVICIRDCKTLLAVTERRGMQERRIRYGGSGVKLNGGSTTTTCLHIEVGTEETRGRVEGDRSTIDVDPPSLHGAWVVLEEY